MFWRLLQGETWEQKSASGWTQNDHRFNFNPLACPRRRMTSERSRSRPECCFFADPTASLSGVPSPRRLSMTGIPVAPSANLACADRDGEGIGAIGTQPTVNARPGLRYGTHAPQPVTRRNPEEKPAAPLICE